MPIKTHYRIFKLLKGDVLGLPEFGWDAKYTHVTGPFGTEAEALAAIDRAADEKGEYVILPVHKFKAES